MKLRIRSALVLLLLASSLTMAHAEDIVLFDGKDHSAWKKPLGAWSVVASVDVDKSQPKAFASQPGQGVMLSSAAGKSANITSKAEHGDAEIHIEFTVPQGSNSGIYVQGRYEIQVFDSFGKAAIAEHDCGAIYQRWDPKRGKGNEGYEGHSPKLNASKPPGAWQTFDITFRAPRFDAAGKKVENAKFVKVVHNGQVIHENVEMTGPTRGSNFATEAATGPIVIQGDHGPVAYRELKLSTTITHSYGSEKFPPVVPPKTYPPKTK
jgi:hypothetical protein